MKLTKLVLSTACAGALALTQVAGAQTSDQGSYGSQGQMGGQAGQISSRDHAFLSTAGESNLAAIKIGQLAEQKSTNPSIKNFARQQVQSAQTMNYDLQRIAQPKGMTLPSQLNSTDQSEYTRLSTASGSQFDQEYTRWAAKHSQAALKTFQKEAQHGQSADIKNFASANTSTIQHQYQMAQSLQHGGGAAAAGQADGQSQQPMPSDQGQSSQQPQQHNPY